MATIDSISWGAALASGSCTVYVNYDWAEVPVF
jgi:hypothetical protein